MISSAYIKQSQVSPWEPQQNNLRNPEVDSKPCQTSNVECFTKIIIFFFIKHSILDIWQNSEYASVICCSLFGKIEGGNKINLLAM